MIWVWVLVIVVLTGAVVVVAVGRGEAMSDVYDDRPDTTIPSGHPLTADDVRELRFTTAVRGYRMDEVDAFLARLSADLLARESHDVHSEESGPLADEPGSLVDKSGADADRPGSPAEASGSHVEASGSPAEASGSHVEASGSPAEASGSHVEASGSHVAEAGSPPDEPIHPTDQPVIDGGRHAGTDRPEA